MGTQPQQPQQFLQLYLTPEEASLVLHKLNTAQFTGFGESTLAVTILGKVQSANRVPASAIGPTINQLNAVRDKESLSKDELPEALGKKTFRTIPGMTPKTEESRPNIPESATESIVSETAPPVPPETAPPEEKPEIIPSGAPMAALDEAKTKETEAKPEVDESIPPPDAGVFSVINRDKNRDNYI